MAIYEVTLRQDYYGEQVLNVFTYTTNSGIGVAPSSLELLTEMGFIPDGEGEFPVDTVFEALRETANPGLLYASVSARNLYSLTDFYEAVYSPAVAGTGAGGAYASPLLAYGLYSNRVRTDIRRGMKRLAGVSEEYMGGGGVIAGAQIALLATLAERMSAVLEGTALADYSPSVLAFEKYETPSGKFAYQPWATEGEQMDHAAVGVTWTSYSTIRSQTSRQYGRGQ